MTHERRPWWAMPLCETSRRTIREARQRAQQTGQNAELAEHAAMIRRLGKRVIEDIIHIGHRLTKAKDLVDHGGWEDWLREEFGWSADTALNFMRVYKLSESRNFRDLLIAPSALYLLVQPRTPETVRDTVLDRAEAGETITVAAVQTELREQPAAAESELSDQNDDEQEQGVSERTWLGRRLIAANQAAGAARIVGTQYQLDAGVMHAVEEAFEAWRKLLEHLRAA